MSGIWEEFEARTSDYVGRCSHCGRYKNQLRDNNKLLVHWFFNGVYCTSCVQDVLYNDVRTLSEVKK